MQYLLLIYTDEKGMQALPPEQNGAVLAAMAPTWARWRTQA